MAYRASHGLHSEALTFFGGAGVAIHFQDGPIAEYGRNGTTNEEIIDLLIARLNSLNMMHDGRYACPENGMAVGHLIAARAALELRTARRQERGVEGTSAI